LAKSKPTTTRFKSVGAIIAGLADLLRPPLRISVAESAEKYRYVNQPGAFVGWWRNHTTPYMVEPMNLFTSRKYNGIVFVGPAQSSKTDSLVINTVVYSVIIDPMDMMIVGPSMFDVRDFSMRRIDRLHRHSTAVGERMLPGADNDNKFDKQYSNGMMLSMVWPTSGTLAGKPVGRVVLTDYDRMADDIDGEGNAYDLASKRTTTFGSYAMTVAESSPSKPVTNTKWIPTSKHEAPPCGGILSLYNRGDRRRYYWPCPHCGQYFEGNFKMLQYDDWEGATNLDRAETVRMICPFNGCVIVPDDRSEMFAWGTWLKDGQGFDADGRVIGPEPRTMIASFWLNGVAAAFTNWKKLVVSYLDASDTFERTGDESPLRKFYNTDLAEPYYPKSMDDIRLPEVLKSRAERLPERMVPEGVRFLVAHVDTQKNMWRVAVMGILPGKPFDTVVIDNYDVRKSQRTDDDGERLWVKPNAYLEDWDELVPQVIEKEYELGDGSGRMMAIRFVGCDGYGREGVTTMAYNFYRKLRTENKHRRFIITKGEPKPGTPRTRIGYPDSNRRDIKAPARGDVPVLFMNSNLLKDDLNGRLECNVPGTGMYRTPDWLDDKFYAELCAEIRTDKGWENQGKLRNEAWDLSYGCIALCVSELIRAEHIDWDNPPKWAAEWDRNDMIRLPESEARFTNSPQSAYDFKELGKALA